MWGKHWQRTCCSRSGSFIHWLSKLEMEIAFPTLCVYSRSSWKHWIQSFVHRIIPELCPLPWRTCHIPSTFHTEWLQSQLISLLMQPFCSWNAQAENIHWFYLTKGPTKLRIKSRIRSVFPMKKYAPVQGHSVKGPLGSRTNWSCWFSPQPKPTNTTFLFVIVHFRGNWIKSRWWKNRKKRNLQSKEMLPKITKYVM